MIYSHPINQSFMDKDLGKGDGRRLSFTDTDESDIRSLLAVIYQNRDLFSSWPIGLSSHLLPLDQLETDRGFSRAREGLFEADQQSDIRSRHGSIDHHWVCFDHNRFPSTLLEGLVSSHRVGSPLPLPLGREDLRSISPWTQLK